MYSDIRVILTEEKDKYLFIKGNNLIYGGFVVRDIIELLKEKKNSEIIAKELSTKYGYDIEVDTINYVVNNQIEGLLLNPKKKRSLRKIFRINLSSNINYPSFFKFLFKQKIFFFLFSVTLILNTGFCFFLDKVYSISILEKITAYFILFIILIFHEFGHIISAKFQNTNVNEIGIGIYRIIPVLYVNLDEIWKLDKKKRIIINLSGIYFQSIIGLLLVFLFQFSGQEIFIYLFSINYAVLILNLNPFFQFDGYWVLTDILDERNLNKTSNHYLKNILKKNSVSRIIKIYSCLKVLLFAYILYHFISKVIMYVS